MAVPALRTRSADDYVGIVSLYTQQEPDSLPLTVERYRMERAAIDAAGSGEAWVAVDGDRVIGLGAISPAWWTGDPSVFSLELRVDLRYRRRGIGTSLFKRLLVRSAEHGATRMLCWRRADAHDGLHFAEHRSFHETGQQLDEYRLYIPDAAVDAYSGLAERLSRMGLRLASLADLETGDERLLRALQRLWAESGADSPPDAADLCDSFATWRREVLDSSGQSADTHWVALDGERPVGMTFLKRLSAEAAENDYTAVAPTHRGRGIAPALKLRAIDWARQHDVRWFYTSSEIGNGPMIGINRRLGYRPGVRRIEVARTLP